MKKTMVNKKLSLSKETIANLSQLEMDSVHGGVLIIIGNEPRTIINPPYKGALPWTCDGYTCFADPERKQGICLGMWDADTGTLINCNNNN